MEPDPKIKATEFARIVVRTKDLPLAFSEEELSHYQTSQFQIDRATLNRIMRQEAQERVKKPKFEIQWEDLTPGDRARLWALAVMADTSKLRDDEKTFMARIIPEYVPTSGPRLEEFFRGLRGTGLVKQEEAVRVYIERLKTGPTAL